MPKRIAIFASGSGSNFQNLTEWFKEKSTANIVLLASNKPKSKSIQKALDLGEFVCFQQRIVNKTLWRSGKINR